MVTCLLVHAYSITILPVFKHSPFYIQFIYHTSCYLPYLFFKLTPLEGCRLMVLLSGKIEYIFFIGYLYYKNSR